MLRLLTGIILGLFISFSYAGPQVLPLPANEAFKLSATYDQPTMLTLHWQIAPHYYLYRDKISINRIPLDNPMTLGSFVLPPGIVKQDTVHGHYQAYAGNLTIHVPLVRDNKKDILDLAISYQGCSEDGFCYPPINKRLKINLSDLSSLPRDLTNDMTPMPKNIAPSDSKQAMAEGVFYGRSLVFIILSFMGLGLLLAFTPCVLPMIPILSGIIVGHGKRLKLRSSFLLSLSYVLGMAITYAMAGMGVALLGRSIQAELQRPWVIVMFSTIFVLLALSLFGLYELQMPNSWQRRITAWSNRQKGGSYFGVFIMGGISSLIVSPCVSPPLIGVLSYIANSGNMVLGALALFALGLGMGLPLLLVGLSAGHILPKAGAWMGVIEKLMGVTMLGFAIWMLSRVIPGYVTLFLWSILSIVSAIFLGLFLRAANDFQKLCRGFSLVLLIYGVILMMGAALGNADVLHPWENWKVTTACQKSPVNKKSLFLVVKNEEQLDLLLAEARANRKVVLLDFYADWCESCVKMDKQVFATEAVKNILADMVILRIDVTTNDDFSQAMLNRFHVVAPPTILFFNQDGSELTADRLIGEMSAAEFIAQIKRIQE